MICDYYEECCQAVVAHVFNPSTLIHQADFWVQGQPGLQSELQDIQVYTEKPCLEQQNKQTKNQNKKRVDVGSH